jgi:hypothetical protein
MSLSNLLIEALKAYIELEHQDVVGGTYMAGADVTRARSRWEIASGKGSTAWAGWWGGLSVRAWQLPGQVERIGPCSCIEERRPWER